MHDSFGKRCYVSGYAFTGPTDPEQINAAVLEVIESIGMTPIFDSKVFTWTEDGVGFIHVQCLYESFVAVDVWPKHLGGYLFVISCKPYDHDQVAKTMAANGFSIGVAKDFPLWLT